MNLLYVGNFVKWNDKNEKELEDALKTFDKITIAVFKKGIRPKKGQPIRILMHNLKNRVKIVYFKNLAKFLKENKEYKYILFER